MKKLILIAFLFIIFFSSCNSVASENKSAVYNEKSAEQLKQREKNNPAKFLVVTKKDPRKNLLGKTVLEGTIRNIATTAKFRDIVIKVESFAPSGTLLSTEQFTRYQIFEPGKDVTYKLKTYTPKQTKTVEINVTTAVPMD